MPNLTLAEIQRTRLIQELKDVVDEGQRVEQEATAFHAQMMVKIGTLKEKMALIEKEIEETWKA